MVKKRLKLVLILIILGVALNSFQNRNVDFISSIEAPELIDVGEGKATIGFFLNQLY